MVDKLIVVDVSPITGDRKLFGGIFELMGSLQRITLNSNMTLSEVRLDADRQLQAEVNSAEVRQFLLTNLVKKNDGTYGWRINLPVLISEYGKLAEFPDVTGLSFDGPTMLIKGDHSDFIRYLKKKYMCSYSMLFLMFFYFFLAMSMFR